MGKDGRTDCEDDSLLALGLLVITIMTMQCNAGYATYLANYDLAEDQTVRLDRTSPICHLLL